MSIGHSTLSLLSLLTSIALSLIALLVSFYTFRRQVRDNSYSDVDAAYFKVLELAIANPALRDPERTSTYFRLPQNHNYRIQYESYAFMCWNIVETIYDRQEDSHGRFGVSPTWLPVVVEENRLHYHWFCRNLRLFKSEFQRFVMNQLNNLDVQLGSVRDLDDIYPRLERDFPPEELKSRQQIEHLMAGGQYKLYVARHAGFGTVFGYALMFEPKSPNIAWLDYLAIEEVYRDTGFGTLLFNKLCDMLRDTRFGIMLEVERADSKDPETLASQQRRIAFYERIGAKQLDVEYLFPTGQGHPMLLFFKPTGNLSVLPKEEIQAMVTSAYEYIHDDVKNRRAILQQFIEGIRDNPL